MIEGLIGAVSEALEKRWGGEYSVYTENVHQGVQKPCFFVDCESVETVSLLGERYLIRATVCVSIDDDRETKKYETEKIVSEIFDLMRSVEVDGRRVHGRKLNGRYSGDEFKIRGVYDGQCVLKKDENDAFMEIVEEYKNGC